MVSHACTSSARRVHAWYHLPAAVLHHQIQSICFLALLISGGITGIQLEPTLELSLTRTWAGIETEEHFKLNNIFIGPDVYFLIRKCRTTAPTGNTSSSVSVALQYPRGNSNYWHELFAW